MIRRRDDDGVAMISFLMIMMIVSTTAVAAYQVSRHDIDRMTLSQRRVSNVGAAEAGLDLALSMLGSAPLPCSVTGTLDSNPQVGEYSVAISYYDTYPAIGSPLTCTPGIGPSAAPATALLRSVGSAGPTASTSRTMEALVRMTPVPTGSLDKALFSDRSFSPTNNVTMYGNVGNDADLYTNGDFTCANNETINGSVYSQGALSASNNCTVQVDYHARGDVTLTNSVSIGHDVKSSRGNITMSSNSTVSHDAIAFGTNTGGTVVNNRVSGATIADPPTQVMPTVNFDAAEWSEAGWTRQIDAGSNCAQAYSEIAAMSSQVTPTVIQTTCALSWSGNTTITLGANLAVFASGGFTMSNNFTARSTNSTLRTFYLIVPTSAGTTDCTSPGITLRNNTTFQSTISVLFFTPCKVSIENNDGGYGQIYAGVVSVSNNFTFHYRPASIPGVEWIGGTATSFTRDLIYKREVVS